MIAKHVENHRANFKMMLLAFWFCMLAVYRYIRGVNVLGVCNPTLTGVLVEELVELTESAPPMYPQPHFSLTDLAAGTSLLNVSF